MRRYPQTSKPALSIRRISSILAVAVLASLLAQGSLHAQEFTGRFVMGAAGRSVVLTLAERIDGIYEGRLVNPGYEVDLLGQLTGDVLAGEVADDAESIEFIAELSGSLLSLTLFEVDAFGEPIPGAAQSLVFERDSGAQALSVESRESPTERVVVNGRELSAGERAELEATYGVAPLPGEYWYDQRSGLYGVIGYPAFGFMLPGHELGSLASDVSAGDTGVFVNGRELPQTEWLIWSYMLGAPILVGSYWLDGEGNAGYEGSNVPLVNLYLAAQQNAYAGQGGSGGDNFWSTRFSAGNYDSGNSRGYVSVPGYGPVGYGF